MSVHRFARLIRSLCAAAVLGVLLSAVCAAGAAPGASARGANPQVRAALPSGWSVQLSPTFPNHTGDVPTVSVGQGAEFQVTIPGDGACPGSPCWADQGFPIDLYVVEVNHYGPTPSSSPNPYRNNCSQSPSAIQVVSQMSNGEAHNLFLSSGFTWPAAATSTAFGSPYYGLCIHVEVPQYSQFYPMLDFVTGLASDEKANPNYVYQVISDAAPAVHVSPATVQQGQTVTISGQHWVPVYSDYPQTLVGAGINQYQSPNVIINYVSTPANVDANGNFTVTFPITSKYPPGKYYACVGSQNVLTYCQGVGSGVSFNIVAAQPQTGGGGTGTGASPTATTTATANSSGTPTTASGSGAQDTGATPAPVAGAVGSSGSSGFPWLLVLALGLLALLLAGGGTVVAVMLVRRSRMAPPSAEPWARETTLTPVSPRGWERDEPTRPARGGNLDDPWR